MQNSSLLEDNIQDLKKISEGNNLFNQTQKYNPQRKIDQYEYIKIENNQKVIKRHLNKSRKISTMELHMKYN